MELTIENIIKIIIGLVVVAVVAFGIYYFFKNNVIDLFRNFSSNNTAKFLVILF